MVMFFIQKKVGGMIEWEEYIEFDIAVTVMRYMIRQSWRRCEMSFFVSLQLLVVRCLSLLPKPLHGTTLHPSLSSLLVRAELTHLGLLLWFQKTTSFELVGHTLWDFVKFWLNLMNMSRALWLSRIKTLSLNLLSRVRTVIKHAECNKGCQ
jgi:hypothetical protein